MPLGVPSSFQAYDPHPIVVRRAQAAWMEDVDGNRYVDFDLGFGALFAGHCNPLVRERDREPTRRRHAVRHAVRAERRRRRDARRALQAADVAVHQQRHRGDDGRHPRRSWLHRSRQDRQGRGRVPRSSRRGDDLDEATDQRGRARRRTTRHSCDRRHHACRARRHQGHPVQPSRSPRKALGRPRCRRVHRRARDGEHRHLPARSPATCRPCARSLASTARC